VTQPGCAAAPARNTWPQICASPGTPIASCKGARMGPTAGHAVRAHRHASRTTPHPRQWATGRSWPQEERAPAACRPERWWPQGPQPPLPFGAPAHRNIHMLTGPAAWSSGRAPGHSFENCPKQVGSDRGRQGGGFWEVRGVFGRVKGSEDRQHFISRVYNCCFF
jgi:hypothetical protein